MHLTFQGNPLSDKGLVMALHRDHYRWCPQKHASHPGKVHTGQLSFSAHSQMTQPKSHEFSHIPRHSSYGLDREPQELISLTSGFVPYSTENRRVSNCRGSPHPY